MTILSYLRLARALFHSRMMEREEKGIGATGAPLVLSCGPGLISCRTLLRQTVLPPEEAMTCVGLLRYGKENRNIKSVSGRIYR